VLVPMRRIDLLVPRSVAPAAMRAIHRTGLVHLRSFEPMAGTGPAVFGPEPERDGRPPLADAHARIGELAALLRLRAPSPRLVGELWDLDAAALGARVAAMESVALEAERLGAERLALSGDVARLQGYRELMAGLAAVVGGLPRVRGYASTGIVVAIPETVRSRSQLPG